MNRFRVDASVVEGFWVVFDDDRPGVARGRRGRRCFFRTEAEARDESAWLERRAVQDSKKDAAPAATGADVKTSRRVRSAAARPS